MMLGRVNSLLGIRKGTVHHLTQRYLMKEVRGSIGSNISNALENAKGTIFGLMARNMNEKDVKNFFAHWNHRLDDQETKVSTPTPTITTPKSPQVSSSSKVTPSVGYKPIVMPQKSEGKLLYHPLLGELVSDVGYKKIYMTSVHALARTPVWKRQRILRPERAALIADDKVRKGLQLSLPGVITLYQDKHSSEVGIIDGQHRAGALMILAQRGHWDERANNVVIEVFDTDGEDSVATLFSAINAAEPVRLIDLPDNNQDDEDDQDSEDSETTVSSTVSSAASIPTSTTSSTSVTNTAPKATASISETLPVSSVSAAAPSETTPSVSSAVDATLSSPSSTTKPAKKTSSKPKKTDTIRRSPEEEKELITSTIETLRAQYSDMFKPTSRCKMPHVNIDVLRDELYHANVLKVRSFATPEDLLQQLVLINKELSRKFRQLDSETDVNSQLFTKSFQSALNKAQKYEFYLGMEKDWIYDKSLWLLSSSR